MQRIKLLSHVSRLHVNPNLLLQAQAHQHSDLSSSNICSTENPRREIPLGPLKTKPVGSAASVLRETVRNPPGALGTVTRLTLLAQFFGVYTLRPSKAENSCYSFLLARQAATISAFSSGVVWPILFLLPDLRTAAIISFNCFNLRSSGRSHCIESSLAGS